MLQLHSDINFHYEAIRSLGTVRYGGSDLSETLAILDRIKPGDFNDWWREWSALANRVLSTIDESKLDSYSPVTVRDVYFRASHYYFVADFFLHGDPSDPRITEAFQKYRKYFDIANSYLPIPGQRVDIDSGYGFTIPALFYRAADASAENPRPTLIVGGGFDSNMEETLHVFGFPALERGINVILYEGPGQPILLHEQKKGFIAEWEQVVSPVIDYIFDHKSNDLAYIDTDKTGLIGMSLGGYLSARAAAFEPRLAAVICIDGVWSFYDTLFEHVFSEEKQSYDAGDAITFKRLFDGNTTEQSATNRRWQHDHLKFSFQESDSYGAVQKATRMTLEGGIAEKIKMPAFIGDAEGDLFFQGQPERVAKAIGENATLFKFGHDQAAGAHCQSGAFTYLNQCIHEWFGRIDSVGAL